MKDTLDKKYEKELTFDLPIEIHGLKFVPVKLYDYIDFLLASNIFKLEKNDLDVKYIQMTYLDFIVDLLLNRDKDEVFKYMLYKCFSLCLNDESVRISYGLGSSQKSYLIINDIQLSSFQLESIKEIILVQNFPNYSENKILDKDLKKEIEEYDKIINKNKKWVSLEKQIVTVMLSTSLNLEEIYQMPIRKFILALEMADKKMHYVIYKAASMSGLVKFKEEIKHYMLEETNSLESKFVQTEDFVKKINSAHK